MLSQTDIELYNKIQTEIDAHVIAEFGERRGLDLQPEEILEYAKQYRSDLTMSSGYLHARYDIITQNILPLIIKDLNNTDNFKNIVLNSSFILSIKFCKRNNGNLEYLNLINSNQDKDTLYFSFKNVPETEWEAYHVSRLRNSAKRCPNKQIRFVEKRIRDTVDLNICDMFKDGTTVICFQ